MVCANTLSNLLFLSAALTVTSVTHATPIRHDVHRALQHNNGNADVVIVFKKPNQHTLESFEEKKFWNRAQKLDAMLNHLESANADLQRGVFDILNKSLNDNSAPLVGAIHNSSITSNLYVDAANADFIQQVAQLPNVQEIRAPDVVTLDSSKIRILEDGLAPKYWGLEKIMADKVWEAGHRGEGVVIGSIDTGVRYTHEAIKDNYIGGTHGWFDPENFSKMPYDSVGHGTHTVGTMVGKNKIGVAPGAKWMACKGCGSDTCVEKYMIKCLQFMICPTDYLGNNRDCSKSPNIVNNSWGDTKGLRVFDDYLFLMMKNNIMPVFSSGNEGPSCSSVNFPADLPGVIAVGATNTMDGLRVSSSKGPTIDGHVKPDISAPGTHVWSALHESDSDYGYSSGTSHAAPYVSGAIALLLSAQPRLTYTQVKERMFNTTETTTLTGDGRNCGGISDNVFPNNAFGHGRLNVFAAFNHKNPSLSTPNPSVPTPSTPAVDTETPTPSTPIPCASCLKIVRLLNGSFCSSEHRTDQFKLVQVLCILAKKPEAFSFLGDGFTKV